MKTLRAISCALLLAAPTMLLGQDATKPTTPAPIPPGPLLQTRAPDFAQWVMTVTEKKPSSTSGGSPDSGSEKKVVVTVITTTKTGALKMRRLVDSSGASWETWCTGNFQITPRPESGAIIARGKLQDDEVSPFDVDYSQSDFPEIGIVSSKNYVGMETAYGAKCLVFKAMVAPFRDAPPAETKAYVDLKTRLPVAVVIGGSTPTEKTYQFLAPPTETLTLPPEIQKLIQNDKQVSQQGSPWRP